MKEALLTKAGIAGEPDAVVSRAGVWCRLSRDCLTSAGRTSEDQADYLRITLLNLVGAAAFIVWGLFLCLNLLGVVESSVGRLAINVTGLAVAVGVLSSLRMGAPVAVVSHVAHAFLFAFLMGLAILRADNPLTMTLPLIYPAMAFLMLDDVHRGIVGTLLMTAGLNVAIFSGLGPEPRDLLMAIDGALTVSVGMCFQAAVMALYVHHRKRVMTRLRAVSVQLSELACHDPLTGLYNRRTFIDVLERELSRRDRKARQLAFLLFDIDHFKAYNDRFGHPQGDELLKRIAGAAQGVFCRREDIVFRLGGEEFGVVFRTDDAAQAAAMADRLLATIEALDAAPAGPHDTITISAGLNLLDSESDIAANHVYRRADEALYQAKESGRARWVRAVG
ncbi:GGDEF domain-containing protein [Litchfieldella rifensis]|uniref:diguanylate cyclase n=1 Tax=Litchfieldella rifensis TaxID=762643 RepID=A0ABV7LQA4_9GAMM